MIYTTKVALLPQVWRLKRCEQTTIRKAQIVRPLAIGGNRSVITTEDEVVVETYVADRGYLLDPLGKIYVLCTGL